jgi:hypothetical protein
MNAQCGVGQVSDHAQIMARIFVFRPYTDSMIPVLILLAKQYATVIGAITVYLLISRLIGLAFYQSEAMVILVMLLTGFAVIGAVQGVYVRPWWLYLIGSCILALAWLAIMFPLIELIGPGTNDKMGPGGIVFLFPMLAFIFSYPLGGVIQWLMGLTQKRSGS